LMRLNSHTIFLSYKHYLYHFSTLLSIYFQIVLYLLYYAVTIRKFMAADGCSFLSFSKGLNLSWQIIWVVHYNIVPQNYNVIT